MQAARQKSVIDRVTATDMTTLATDHGPVPMNIGAVLVLAGGLTRERVVTILDERAARVPRLRQRMQHSPLGAGRPVWVDDAEFAADRHVSAVPLEQGGGQAGLLAATADAVCRRLPADRPLWRAVLVNGPAQDQAALVLVLHHVMADGLGGLAVLAALSDITWPVPPTAPFPRTPPSRGDLTRDALQARARALARTPKAIAAGLRGLRELGIGNRAQLAARTSLNSPTGARRRLTTAGVDLADVVRVAHARGATVNDVVLTAVSGVLARTLRQRGEAPPTLVISVPISARSHTDSDHLGNAVGVAPVAVPAEPDPGERLAAIAGLTAVSRSRERGASAAPLAALFRGLGAVGLAQVFVDHQRLIHTFETNVHGPASPVAFDGRRVTALIPVAVNPGNVGVSFDVLSYAGTLLVTVVADPEIVPQQEQDLITTGLLDQLRAWPELREDITPR